MSENHTLITSKSIKIVIILTPFHLKQIIRLRKEFKIDFDNAIFIISSNLKKESIEQDFFPVQQVLFIPHNEIHLSNILKKNFREIRRIKTLITDFESNIAEILDSKHIYDVYTGSEKNIFIQTLLIELKKRNQLNYLIGVDEGTAHYAQPLSKDFIIKKLYKTLTPLILGRKYDYFRVLGTSKWYTHLFLRFPKEVQLKNASTKYISFESRNNQAKEISTENKNALFTTSPFSDYNLLPLDKELMYIKQAIELYKDYQIFIKPHPAEKENKYKDIVKQHPNIKLLDKKILAEDLDYFAYSRVINFGTSVLMDLMEMKYPLENITTIDVGFINYPIIKRIAEKGEFLKF